MISFQAQLDNLSGRLKDLAHRQILLANADALNDAVGGVKTDIVKAASAETNIQQKYLRPRVHISKASIRRQVATIKVYRKPISAINMGVQMKITKRKDGTESGRFVLNKKTIERAFVAKSSLNGRVHLFQRKLTANRKYPLPRMNKGRSYPIDAVRFHVYAALTRTAHEYRDKRMAEKYPKRLAHHLQHRMKTYVK